jgi:hypothetical protein
MEQEFYRIRDDTTAANPGTPNWITTENQSTREVIDVDKTFRIRFVIANTGTANATNKTFQPYFKLGAASYAAVGAATAVKYADAGSSTDGDTLTTANFQLTAGTGTASNGEYDENGTTGTNTVAQDDYTEFEFGLEIDGASVSDADTIDIRVYMDDAQLDTYDTNATAIIEVNKAASTSGTGSSAGTSTVSGESGSPASSSGTGTVTGQSGAAASSAGVATAAGLSGSSAAAAGSGVALAYSGSLGTSAGVATVTGAPLAQTEGTGTSAGTSVAQGYSGSLASSAGTSTVQGYSASVAASSGVAAIQGLSGSLGSSAGTSTATGEPLTVATEGTGTSAGTSTVSGLSGSTGTSAGTSTATGEPAAAGIASISGHHPVRHRTSPALLEEERRRLRALEAAKKAAEKAKQSKIRGQRAALVQISAKLLAADVQKQAIMMNIGVLQDELAREAQNRTKKRIFSAFDSVADELQAEILIARARINRVRVKIRNRKVIAALAANRERRKQAIVDAMELYQKRVAS